MMIRLTSKLVRVVCGALWLGVLSAVWASAPQESNTADEIIAMRRELSYLHHRLDSVLPAQAALQQHSALADSARGQRLELRLIETGRRTDAALTDLRYALDRGGAEDPHDPGGRRQGVDQRPFAASITAILACALSLLALCAGLRSRDRNAFVKDSPDSASPTIPATEIAATDHSLAVAVAREVFRASTSGGSPDGTSRSLRRLADEIASRGYTTRDLTGAAYCDGMAARVTEFVVDTGMRPGSSVIRRTLRPEIAHNGRLLEPATVEVTVSPSEPFVDLCAVSLPPPTRRRP